MRKFIEKNIRFDDVRNLYYINMDYGKNESGNRIRKTATAKTLKEARDTLKKFEANKFMGTLLIPDEESIESWFKYWINDIKSRKCEETTLYGYKNIIYNHIIPSIGKYKLQLITPTILNKYFTLKLNEGLSKNTVRKHYDLLKEGFKIAISEEKILKSPIEKIEPIKKEKKEMNCYNINQLNKLFEIVENNRMEIVIKLAGMLGLRREEIAGLKWHNIDFNNSIITISEARTQAGKNTIEKGTKNTSSYRKLFIPDEIKDILIKLKQQQEYYKLEWNNQYEDNEFIMCWENGKPYRPNYLSDLFKKIIDDNKLPAIRLHDLRHSFASVANELGISLYDISKALGHSQVGTTSEIYTHLFDKSHKKAINKISDAFKKSKE